MLRLESFLCGVSSVVGKIASLLLLLLVCNVTYDVFTRYVLSDVSIGMQELEWHLFATIVLIGIAYATTENAHVSVDFLYNKTSPKTQILINITGILLFVIPFCCLIIWYGSDYAATAYIRNEQSGDPGGLPYRWIIKSVIPLSSVLILLSNLGVLLRSIRALRSLPGKNP